MNYERLKYLYVKGDGMATKITHELSDARCEREKAEEELKLTEQAQAFLQKVAQDTQSALRFKVEDIVNLALNTCFPDEYRFELEFTVSRGRTDAELMFYSVKTGRPVDPMNASGGGVVDLTAFALRIACYVLEQDIDNVIVLDEPFRFISRDLQTRAGELVKTLSERLGIQIIMVTHIPELIDTSDRIFKVSKDADGIAHVKVMDN